MMYYSTALPTGKLHRQLISLQASETIALQQLEQTNAKVRMYIITLATVYDPLIDLLGR